MVNATDQQMTWNASVTGLQGSADPQSITLDPGEAGTIEFTATTTGLVDGQWAFGQGVLEVANGQMSASTPATHLPIAIIPVTMDGNRNTARSPSQPTIARITHVILIPIRNPNTLDMPV